MKKLLYLFIIVPLFFISSCEEEKGPIRGCIDSKACNFNPDATTPDESCEYLELGYDCNGNIMEYVVGMEAEGGIVFYVDSSGQHGLVAAKRDLGKYEWGCYEESVDGADGRFIGTGYQNTLDIVNNRCRSDYGNFLSAAAMVYYKHIDGYDDWYLPSSGELKEMFKTIGNSAENNIGGFDDTWYWSSTKYSDLYSTYAQAVDFQAFGFVLFHPKNERLNIRAVRSF